MTTNQPTDPQPADSGASFSRLADGWVLGLFIIAVFSACTSALTRPLWNDEVITSAMAHLAPHAMFEAMQNGADAQPLAFFALTVWARHAPSTPEFGIRLPAIIGFSTLIVAVFVFMRRAKGSVAALVSVAVLASSEGLYYGSEARPYGALLGAVGLAAVLWQKRKRGDHSTLNLICLIIALAAVASLHYYALFVIIIFGLVELFLAWSGRPDWKFFLLLPFSLAPIVLARPLINASRSQYGNAFWAHPTWKSILGGYEFTFSNPVASWVLFRLGSGREISLGDLLPLAFLLAVVGVLFRRAIRSGFAGIRNAAGIPPELVLACGLLLLPLIEGIAGMLVLGAFTPRYAISSLIGAAIVFGWAVGSLGRRPAYLVAAAITLILLLRQLPVDIGRMAQFAAGVTPAGKAHRDFEAIYRRTNVGLPVVVSDGHLFIEACHYSDPENQSRIIYLQDRKLALRFTGNDGIDATNEAWKRYLDLHLEDPGAFLATHRDFVVIRRGDDNEWLSPYLRNIGAHFETVEKSDQRLAVYRVRIGTP
jgi:hypothetical protein